MQIVGYKTTPGEGPAALRVASEGRVERVPLLAGESLAYALAERHCAGATEDGVGKTTESSSPAHRNTECSADVHEACGNEDAPYCDDHTSTWPCARCVGNCAMPRESCHEEHAVYLAAFAPDTFKVGVTRSWRLDTRLREQGADRAAHIRTVEDGKRARQIEYGIAEEIADRVRVPTKIRGFAERVDDDAWDALVAAYDPIERFDFDYGLAFDARPVAETMATGTVLGTKGRVLTLERGGTTYAVDMRDLVGYDVTEGASERDRQSSLGAF
ncbi:DUF2797 domain-containing protein [Halobacterium sp. KA-6]|uniref:DUF2797 domain-containing protein n=1 Tax=Halobacterium sp. KA-6 TaxID=2896368 RepID=UPI001E39A7A5|nr:DUF2797 domain-containing protein [Halobacterium sp. KA-6]MCD2202250.1 DUF2797 domain-containing protein [Halobacterium sp. KA-6]